MPVGCILLDAELRITYWNQAAERLFGYGPFEAADRSLAGWIIPSTEEEYFNRLLQEAREGKLKSFKFEGTTKNGNRRIYQWQITPSTSDPNSLLAFVQEYNGSKDADGYHQVQSERIRALRTIDTAITGSMDFQVTLNVIVKQAMSQLKMDAVVMLVYEPGAQTLNFAAGRGLRTNALQFTNLRIGEGYAGISALRKRVIQVPDLERDQRDFVRSPRFSQEGFQSYFCVPLIAKGEIKGVMESFHRTRFQPDMEWLDFFETLAGQAAIAIDNAMLFNDLQRSNLELTLAYDTTLEGWSKALDMRDRDTEGHTRRVTEMTDHLALAFNISAEERIHIRRGAILHDIGKMAIPDSILLKEGPLTDEEWTVMRQHPVLAMNMLASIAYLRPALDIPHCHHEKWDGTGYPRGLRGDQIPLAARIFSVVDVFDALTSDRPYRRAWSTQQALQYIEAEKGQHFDPQIADVFVSIISTRPPS